MFVWGHMVPVSASESEASDHAGANSAEASLGLSVTQLQDCNVPKLRKLARSAQVKILGTTVSQATRAQVLDVLGPLVRGE